MWFQYASIYQLFRTEKTIHNNNMERHSNMETIQKTNITVNNINKNILFKNATT